MFLTKSSTPVIGWVAALLGFIMNGIFIAQSAVGLDNIGLCIILFTIVIYLLMTPLTYQQQKFSRLSAKMQPEVQAIQNKYKGKNNDQAAMAKMNEETQAVYAKYGVNPMGSCLQLLIQMPILFALYRVIWNIPAYVDKVKNAFMPLATALLETSGAEEYMSEAASSLNVSFKSMTDLTLIDVLYKFKPANWTSLAEAFPDLSETIETTRTQVDHMNYFLGLNIADSPMNIIKSALSSGAILLVIGAALIPILAAVTQWLNAKLMTNNNSGTTDENNTMAQSMKTMNTMMPLMSAFFCLTLPVGLGIYWIAGAVVRSIQQVVLNKKIDQIDVDELVKQNFDKLNEKRAKEGLPAQKMTSSATMSTRNIDAGSQGKTLAQKAGAGKRSNASASADTGSDTPDASAASPSKYKPGSLAAKAHKVEEYNRTHSKK